MHTRRIIILTIGFVFGCAPARPPVSAAPTPRVAIGGTAAPARLVAVEVFDTDPSGADRVLARHGDALRALQRVETQMVVSQLRSLVEAIRADGDYAYVESALVTYFQPHVSYLTIDLVDRHDAAQRMPFLAAPTGIYADPRGLLATWQRYEATFFRLLERGEISGRPVDCPAFQCLGDPNEPALRSLVAEMTTGVPGHIDELVTILRDDSRDERRATAAYLLAYVTDGNTVVADLIPALHDPSALVRNNAMRVLAEIALRHPELDVPLGPVLEALSYPSTTDRNKAAAILDRLLRRPGSAGLFLRVAREAGPALLAMLRLQQPNNHDFAFNILKTISGEAYGEHDYAAWQTWLTRDPAY